MIAGVMILLSAVFLKKYRTCLLHGGCVYQWMCEYDYAGSNMLYESAEAFKCTVFDELMKTTVPVSAMLPGNNDDYIMLADNACDYENIYETSDKAEETSKKESVPVKDTDEVTTPALGEADTGSDTDTAVQNVIQRKEITGTVYNKTELSDYGFVHNHFYTITSITELTESILRPDDFINRNLAIDKSSRQPQILIFHTHSQEGFIDSVEADAKTTIVGVGDYLTKLLTERYGYNVIHDTTVYDYVDGKLDRSKAYTYAENGIAKILNDNPSIEVVIDLHRDGVADTTHLVTQMDGKSMAKIMFLMALAIVRLMEI